jgi:ABC-type sugar transport system ATPase subunit
MTTPKKVAPMITPSDVLVVAEPQPPITLRAQDISKSFGGVRALNSVSVEFPAATVTALLGENGAGKSTFISICSGVLQPDTGSVALNGEPQVLRNPLDALEKGIAVVHQEPQLANELSVAENIYLTRLATAKAFSPAKLRNTYHDAERHLEALQLSGYLSVHTRCTDLTAAQRQLVVIARALTAKPAILFLDEPNSSLTRPETELLFTVIRNLKAEGIAIVFVTHRLSEVYEIANRVVVFRDGSKVADTTPEQLPIASAVRLMAGSKLIASIHEGIEHSTHEGSEEMAGTQSEILRVEGLSGEKFTDISFALHASEIVGVAGLVGSGRTEIARAIVGADRLRSGTILLDGKPLRPTSPQDTLRAGIAFVSEERRTAVFYGHSVLFNMTASIISRLQRFGVIRRRLEISEGQTAADRLKVKAPSLFSSITELSGGNQQKVIIARALSSSPRVLILDEPTRGVDVGTKAEIYDLLRGVARQGVAICFISSELEEVLALAERIIVVRNGRIAQDVPAGPDAETVLAAAFGEKIYANH